MRHEKIINRNNGDKIIIITNFWMDSSRDYSPVYDQYIQVVPKGKRKRISPDKPESYVSPAELLQAMLDVWEKLKPISNYTAISL